MLGTAPTSAGVRVSQETALTYSAAMAATRVITEGLASLPLMLLEQVDDRTTRKATDHPLYPVVHDIPNPEQDIVSWLDTQSDRQVNWGNGYAEIQRDTSGSIVALWPIHTSRIPVCNIERNPVNPSQWRHIQVGQPGEIVYYAKNDDGTESAIPASDMLNVTGVLSRNGITGVPIPVAGAESLGIAIATDRHAGAFFRNGAVSNLALKHPKTVGKEAAERLRDQWQRVYGGAHNHYKTLILEDGMEPVDLTFAPEAAQLLEARQFSVNEIARLYKVPPHMIGDLSRATWANIESEAISFVVHTMLPWIVRWEKAMYRQLLTEEERKRYRFKFNVMGLLRGDSAARGVFYQVLFNMGAASPNDIRAMEDMNPIPGGDQYFVPANNLMPLDKIGEMAQAQIDKLTAPPPTPQQNSAPDEKTAAALVEIRNQQREFMDKVLLRDATAEARETARAEFDRQQREKDVATYGHALEEILQRHRADAENARDTAEIERLAAERAIFEAEQAKADAAVAAEREVTRRVFAKALKREIDKLSDWEWKWLDKATEKPAEWVQSRAEFYARFNRYFVTNLGEYQPESEACGIILDLEWASQRYSGDSVRDLKSLDGHAADNYHDKLREFVHIYRKSQWTERSTNLANDMVERGVRLFEERQQQKGT